MEINNLHTFGLQSGDLECPEYENPFKITSKTTGLCLKCDFLSLEIEAMSCKIKLALKFLHTFFETFWGPNFHKRCVILVKLILEDCQSVKIL